MAEPTPPHASGLASAVRRRRRRSSPHEAPRARSGSGLRLALLERKQLLDRVWVATLACQLGALWLAAWLGEGRAPGWGALAGVALFAASADQGYRLRTPRALGAAVAAHQAAGTGIAAWLWALGGGAASPLGLAFLVPPLVASALVGPAALALGSGALALAGVWGVAWVQGAASTGLAPLVSFSGAVAALVIAAPRLSASLRRLHAQLSGGDSADETRGVAEAVLRAAGDPHVGVYSDTFLIAQASESFFQRMLLDPKEAVGRSLYNVIELDDRARLAAALAAPRGELPLQRLRIGPETVVAHLRFHRVEHAGTRYTCVAFGEVTELDHLRAAYDAIDEIVLVVGADGALRYANRAAGLAFGELYPGKSMLAILRGHHLTRGELADARSLHRVALNGAPYHLDVASAALPGGEQSYVLRLSAFAQRDALADPDTHDPLTGVGNRRVFERRLQRLVLERDPGTPLALALWNLDGLKEVNAAHGHRAGDLVLREFTRLLGERIRPLDVVCRLDGDTFATIHPGLDLFGAEVVVQAVLGALERHPVATDGEPRPIAVSAGISVCRPLESANALVARADDALYEAKELGGAGYALRDPDGA